MKPLLLRESLHHRFFFFLLVGNLLNLFANFFSAFLECRGIAAFWVFTFLQQRQLLYKVSVSSDASSISSPIFSSLHQSLCIGCLVPDCRFVPSGRRRGSEQTSISAFASTSSLGCERVVLHCDENHCVRLTACYR